MKVTCFIVFLCVVAIYPCCVGLCLVLKVKIPKWSDVVYDCNIGGLLCP